MIAATVESIRKLNRRHRRRRAGESLSERVILVLSVESTEQSLDVFARNKGGRQYRQKRYNQVTEHESEQTQSMDVSETLQTLYTTTIEQNDGTYHITVPDREIATGTVAENEIYRVALMSTATPDGDTTESPHTTHAGDHEDHQQEDDGPPVEDGEQRVVEIETLGDQGDGIAKVERGYVVIVPETEIGDRVTVEMRQVRENVAFADVVEHTPHNDV